MFKRLIVRAVRSAVATALGAAAAKVQSDPKWLAAIPLLQALGKAIRDRWPKVADLVPF